MFYLFFIYFNLKKVMYINIYISMNSVPTSNNNIETNSMINILKKNNNDVQKRTLLKPITAKSKKKKKLPSLSEQEKFLLEELKVFYTTEKIERIKPIINQESLSLRVIDWTPTNYCKKHCIKIKLKSTGEIIDIYQSYKNHVSVYIKNKLFDVFKRGQCIKFYYQDNDEDFIITSVKQLNIFRWLLKYEILDFIEENEELIKTDMKLSLRQSANAKKGNKTEQSRQELSKSAYKKCIKYNHKTVVTF